MSKVGKKYNVEERILGLQPRDKAAMLVVNTKETFLLNVHQNRVYFPAERNAFVLDPQRGRRGVACKPAINSYFVYLTERLMKVTKVALNVISCFLLFSGTVYYV